MENKVRVVVTVGRTSTLGYMDPHVGMPTNLGIIAAFDAFGVCTMNDTGPHPHGGRSRFHAHQLLVLQTDAAGYGWPGGADCVLLGHAKQGTIYPGGDSADKRWYVDATGKPKSY